MRVKLLNLFNSALKQSGYINRNAYSSYKSAISLSTLYPQSSLNLAIDVKPPISESEQFSGYIPIDKLEITYSRSTGPGGQHVNKVNTKVDIRFHLKTAGWLTEEMKSLLAEKNQGRLNKDGFFIVRSDKTRSQVYNQADAITKLRGIIYEAIESSKVSEPSPETLHMLRKRQERANIERLAKKKIHSQKKSDRQTPNI